LPQCRAVTGFITSAAESGAALLRIADQLRHKSLDVLRGDVRRADIFQGSRRSGIPVIVGDNPELAPCAAINVLRDSIDTGRSSSGIQLAPRRMRDPRGSKPLDCRFCHSQAPSHLMKTARLVRRRMKLHVHELIAL
jgi:hypothetical protein